MADIYYAEYEKHPVLIGFESSSESSADIQALMWLDDFSLPNANPYGGPQLLGSVSVETDAESGNSKVVDRAFDDEPFGDRLQIWIDTSVQTVEVIGGGSI